MARVKRGVTAHAKHKKVLKKAKGDYGGKSRVFRAAKQATIKAGQYAYRDRRVKSVKSAPCGFSASTPAHVNTASATADLSTDSPRPAWSLIARCWLTSRFMTRLRSLLWRSRHKPSSPPEQAGVPVLVHGASTSQT